MEITRKSHQGMKTVANIASYFSSWMFEHLNPAKENEK